MTQKGAVSDRLREGVIRRLERIAAKYGEEHALDLAVACKACGADVAQECRADNRASADLKTPIKPGVVHFGRRLRRLLRGAA